MVRGPLIEQVRIRALVTTGLVSRDLRIEVDVKAQLSRHVSRVRLPASYSRVCVELLDVLLP